MSETAAPPIQKLHWENIVFLTAAHLCALLGIAWGFLHFSWWTVGLALLWLSLTALSTTGGYHRLFAHRTYQCASGLRLFYLLFGAAAFQGSALMWSSDHRDHHVHTDEDADPYNITKGFWWAHLGWLFFRPPEPNYQNSKDLLADPLVAFQDRHYRSLGTTMCFLVPTLIAFAWGDPIGGLLIAGFLRLCVLYQATFSINSVTHTIGRQPYSKDTSARDSFLAALITFGEGYHNYHHRFPADYRNGVRAYHFDPTKWWVWALSKIGVTWDLRRVPEPAIRKAREELERKRETAGV